MPMRPLKAVAPRACQCPCMPMTPERIQPPPPPTMPPATRTRTERGQHAVDPIQEEHPSRVCVLLLCCCYQNSATARQCALRFDLPAAAPPSPPRPRAADAVPSSCGGGAWCDPKGQRPARVLCIHVCTSIDRASSSSSSSSLSFQLHTRPARGPGGARTGHMPPSGVIPNPQHPKSLTGAWAPSLGRGAAVVPQRTTPAGRGRALLFDFFSTEKEQRTLARRSGNALGSKRAKLRGLPYRFGSKLVDRDRTQARWMHWSPRSQGAPYAPTPRPCGR